MEKMPISPRDVITDTNSKGHQKVWIVEAVLIGGTNQDSVVQLKPVGAFRNSNGTPTLCPISILEHAIDSGKTKHFAARD